MAGNSKNYVLTPRDLSLLRTIGMLLVIDREQARTIGGFGSITRVNTRLLALTRLGLLKRFFLAIGAGTKKAIYCLTEPGAAIADVPYRRVRTVAGSVVGMSLFLEHQLRLNDLYLLTSSNNPEHVAVVSGWRFFRRQIAPNTFLIPDGYFEVRSPGSAALKPVFVEVDLATESSRVWRKKVAGYVQLASSGDFLRIFGHQQFRVAVVAPSERRVELIRRTAAEQTNKIFFLTTFSDIKRAGFWSSIWTRPEGGEKHAFL